MMRCTNTLDAMATNPHRQRTIRDIVRDRMVQSGVDNYSFVDGQLKIGSSRYAVEVCGCGESDCDGLRLRRVHQSMGYSAILPFNLLDTSSRTKGTA